MPKTPEQKSEDIARLRAANLRRIQDRRMGDLAKPNHIGPPARDKPEKR